MLDIKWTAASAVVLYLCKCLEEYPEVYWDRWLTKCYSAAYCRIRVEAILSCVAVSSFQPACIHTFLNGRLCGRGMG